MFCIKKQKGVVIGPSYLSHRFGPGALVTLQDIIRGGSLRTYESEELARKFIKANPKLCGDRAVICEITVVGQSKIVFVELPD